MLQNTPIRVMTYNIGGGRKDFGSDPRHVLEIAQELSPDILAVQECIEWNDAENVKNSFAQQIAETLGYGENYFFGKTLSLQENLQERKAIMLFGLYNDWEDWAQGNALYSKQGFVRLGDPNTSGHPRNISIYKPQVYEGTRDTDPRYAILGRARFLDLSPYIVCTHLTTLIGERGGEMREIAGKSNDAQLLRFEQTKRLLDLLRPKIEDEQIIILMGDFNARADEACISSVLESEGGFVRLIPQNDISTHPKVEKAVDHILVYPQDKVLSYSCWVDDSDLARGASDHLPVIADIVFK
jgi:endonuclease/exonuclease/phosphatase family metal-dependent hydrolase